MLKDKRIDNFIDSVCAQIHTEGEADEIKEELSDHIDCLIEDYEEMGLEKEVAVGKSLLQMGDPKEIGYSFRDLDVMRRRTRNLLAYKIVSMLMFLAAFIGFLLTLTSEKSSGLSSAIPLYMIMFNAFNVAFAFSNKQLLKKSKFMDIDTSPLLIIWPVKRKIPWEYFIVFVIFSPIILLFSSALFSGVLESGMFIESTVVIVGVIGGIFTFFYGEKFRIPKYILIDDGMIISNKYISWTAINNVKWEYYHNKGKKLYSFRLQGCNNIPIARAIKVSENQRNLINRIIQKKI